MRIENTLGSTILSDNVTESTSPFGVAESVTWKVTGNVPNSLGVPYR